MVEKHITLLLVGAEDESTNVCLVDDADIGLPADNVVVHIAPVPGDVKQLVEVVFQLTLSEGRVRPFEVAVLGLGHGNHNV